MNLPLLSVPLTTKVRGGCKELEPTHQLLACNNTQILRNWVRLLAVRSVTSPSSLFRFTVLSHRNPRCLTTVFFFIVQILYYPVAPANFLACASSDRMSSSD